MSLIFDSVLSDLLAVLVIVVATVYWYFSRSFKFWDNKGLPNVPPSFPAGNIGPCVALKVSFGIQLQELYNHLKDKGAYGGFYLFGSPALMVNDPEQVKNVLIKDFHNFADRGVYYNELDDPISAHLFSIEGQKWRNLRAKLTPTFTSGKLKNMLPIMLDCADKLRAYLLKQFAKEDEVEMKDVLARFTTDIIGTCAFGIEFNSLKDPDSEFRRIGSKVFSPSFYENIKLVLATSYRDLAKRLHVKAVSHEISSFFMKLVADTVEYREKNNVKRNDFMDLLIQLKNKGRLDDDVTKDAAMSALTLDEVSAQAFIFFVAGYETSSTTMSFCIYELAMNETLQDKARKEVKAQYDKNGGKMNYEALLQLPYLDQAINETFRKYPTLPVLNRQCANDYQLPDTDIVVPKGTPVFISVRGLHHDPEYFPNPDTFDPDRFTEENKATRHHFAFLPFGEGPRICIGLRFGLMQTRLGLATLLLHFKWSVTDKTPNPLIVNPKSFVTNCLGGIVLKYEPIDNTK